MTIRYNAENDHLQIYYDGVWNDWTRIGYQGVLVIINGVPNETVTFSDGSTILLDQNGIKETALPYYITSAIGSVGNYAKEFVVTKNTTKINVWPDGALYWHGKQIVPFTWGNSSYSGQDSRGTVTFNSDHIHGYTDGDDWQSFSLMTQNIYPSIGFTKICVDLRTSAKCDVNLGVGTNNTAYTYSNKGSMTQKIYVAPTVERKVIEMVINTERNYYFKSYATNCTGSVYYYAIWFE